MRKNFGNKFCAHVLCAPFVTMLYLKPKSVSEDFVYRSPPPCSLHFQPTGKTENPPAVNRSGSSLPCQGGGLISSFPSLRLVWAQRARILAVARSAAAGGCLARARFKKYLLAACTSRGAARAIHARHHISIVCMYVSGAAGVRAWLHSVGIPQRSARRRTPPRLNLIPRRD